MIEFDLNLNLIEEEEEENQIRSMMPIARRVCIIEFVAPIKSLSPPAETLELMLC